MAYVKLKYASSASITCTINSLGDGSARESTAVSNATNLYVDCIVQVRFFANSSGVDSNGYCNVYVYGTGDGGTLYDDDVTGSDSAHTIQGNLHLARRVALDANSQDAPVTFSLKRILGQVPEEWGIVVENQSGAALNLAGNSANYTGVHYEVA